MKYSVSATSIVEAMIVLLIVVTGITWVYKLMYSSTTLTNSTAMRIEAIQIARDGLEAFTNIRNTNWVRFAADYENCWNVLNYEEDCIWDTSTTYDMRQAWVNQGFTIYRNSDHQFEVHRYGTVAGVARDYTDDSVGWYRELFRVFKDDRDFYTQTGTLGVDKFDFLPIYTREIQIDYLQDDDSAWNSNDPKMQVTAIVMWNDPASPTPRELQVSTLLTNWKSRN